MHCWRELQESCIPWLATGAWLLCLLLLASCAHLGLMQISRHCCTQTLSSSSCLAPSDCVAQGLQPVSEHANVLTASRHTSLLCR